MGNAVVHRNRVQLGLPHNPLKDCGLTLRPTFVSVAPMSSHTQTKARAINNEGKSLAPCGSQRVLARHTNHMTDPNIVVMPTALFYNFSDEVFEGKWGGQTKMFAAGSKTYMPAYLAQHFAKHLTNRELQKQGKDTATSPKEPEDVPEFLAMFRTAYVRDRDMEKKKNSLDQEIDAVNLNRQQDEPSMNIPSQKEIVTPAEKALVQELDLNAPIPRPHEDQKTAIVLNTPDDNEDEDENVSFESPKSAPTPVVAPVTHASVTATQSPITLQA